MEKVEYDAVRQAPEHKRALAAAAKGFVAGVVFRAGGRMQAFCREESNPTAAHLPERGAESEAQESAALACEAIGDIT